MSSEKNEKGPDDVITELGGCGLFQIRVAVIVHLMNVVAVWSIYAMVFVTASVKWRCRDDDFLSLSTNGSQADNNTFGQVCFNRNGSACSELEFDTSEMHTIVTEWGLVCDKAWIPALINSIQLGFSIIGHILAGHLADLKGRKFSLYFSLVALILCNVLSYFSVNWLMYLVSQAFSGIAGGMYMTLPYTYMSEFASADWRPWVVSFPSWSMESCILVLVLWLLKDWRNTHLVIALVGCPFFLTWWLLPESFRWFYAHDEIEEAEKIITKIAHINQRQLPDLSPMKKLAITSREENEHDKKYTILDLFKSKALLKVTLLLLVNWFAMGLVGNGINFGIQRLAGSIYLNMFLFALVTIPAKFIVIWLTNRIGRRYTAILLFFTTVLSALTVGIVQYIDMEHRDSLTNIFAIVAKVGNATVWGTIQTMTVEIFPTVVRNISYGLCSTILRIGAALAPQLVFLEIYIPGILYFCCGGISVLCIWTIYCLPETKDSKLSDKLKQTFTNEEDTKYPKLIANLKPNIEDEER